MFERIIIVTRKTRLGELVARFNTKNQAKFNIEHAGQNFTEFDSEDQTYRSALDKVLRELDLGLTTHVIDRELVSTYLFTEKDVVVTLGQDGLVANVAKYVRGQPIVAVNPDPARFDGVLLPIPVHGAAQAVTRVVSGKAEVRAVSLAQARLDDGQQMLAFNDLFIGASSHVSARYEIALKGRKERQSSSGVLVSTGAGSTGWLSSVFSMVNGVCGTFGGQPVSPVRLSWDDRRLAFVVREPFVSKHSSAEISAGLIEPGEALQIESRMPLGGVVFSDGVEADFLPFNAGARATVSVAEHAAHLIV